jgi:ribosomal protein S27AE
MPSRKKINLEKVLASLDAACPKCGRVIPPADVRRVDFERIECPGCGDRFTLGDARVAC